MTDGADLEARVAALESRVDSHERRVAAAAEDAKAARHLAAARDRDIADLQVEVRAIRSAVNGLDEQTAGGFAEMRAKFEQTETGFAEMRAKFDQQAAGQQQIASLLTQLINRDED